MGDNSAAAPGEVGLGLGDVDERDVVPNLEALKAVAMSSARIGDGTGGGAAGAWDDEGSTAGARPGQATGSAPQSSRGTVR